MKKLCEVKWLLWGLSFNDVLLAQNSLDAMLKAVLLWTILVL